MSSSRKLRVFLCHASHDKPAVLELYNSLESEGWIDPWLDKAKILPGQDWRLVIEKAVEDADVVIVCLSNQAVNKEGFVQREIKYAYDIALEKPEETIFLIPLRLDACVVPRGLRSFQWVDYYGRQKIDAYSDLLKSLRFRYEQKLDLGAEKKEEARLRREEVEKRERERLARQKEEKERQEREDARLEAEKKERARLARQTEEKERHERENARLEAEKKERARLARQKEEKERQKRENARLEAPKKEREKISTSIKSSATPKRIINPALLLPIGILLFFSCCIFLWWVDATYRWCTFLPFISGCP